MKIEELRIGNWVNIDGRDECVDAHWIYMLELDANGLKPIPLKEEILLSSGFYWDKKKVYLCLNETAFRIRYSRNQLTLFQSSQYLTIPDIKYLHQLQNLYFALTQEELNIEL